MARGTVRVLPALAAVTLPAFAAVTLSGAPRASRPLAKDKPGAAPGPKPS